MYISIYTYSYIHACTYINKHVYVCVYIYANMNCKYTFTYINIYVCILECIEVFLLHLGDKKENILVRRGGNNFFYFWHSISGMLPIIKMPTIVLNSLLTFVC